jgi:dUTP pyrophosphatase
LTIGDENTKIEIGDFMNSDINICGFITPTLNRRICNLFLSKQYVEANFKLTPDEMREFSDIMYRKYLKEMENTGDLTFNIEKTSEAAVIPTKAHESDAGFDLYSPFDFTLNPGETKLINFHIKIGLQPGWEAQVRNRSGIVTNYRCMIPIGVGTIDSQYTGEIRAPLYCFNSDTIHFKAKSRIAQLVIKKTYPVYLKEGKVYNNNGRSEGGFGSTGV